MSADQGQVLREQFDYFPVRVLTWVGALPTWTADLGARLRLADSAEAVTELARRLEAEDLIETGKTLDAEGRPAEAFWLRPSLRQGLGGYLQRSGAARLDRDLGELADAVASLDVTSATAGSIGSAQWLTIVRTYRADPSGLRLMDDVDELVAAGRLGDASALVAAARGLGELSSRALLEASRRAQWRIDRASRIEQDVARLRHYCPRQHIEAAIKDLLETDEPWALHLLGDGGVGKTMLIRYLASGRFAAEREVSEPFLVARADFDHLDPRYPEQRPAELLLALAADLTGFTRTRELYRLRRAFQDAASALHEELAGTSGVSGASTLRETVRAFCEFVNGLGSPALLVLDTCEELEKLYLPRAPAPAIDETFRLLELVHSLAPTVRVLFAGRRRLVPASGAAGAAGPLLRPRPYLRVLDVGGFTQAEADAYIEGREAALRPDLRRAVLDRSRSSGLDDSAEYNPFELAAYCDWVSSDPDLDYERLRWAPGDPYVEWRIVGRLGDDRVRAALGVAAEFGRFDLSLITPALARAGIDARAAFDGLAAQEWVNVLSLREDGAPAVVEIDQHLLARIRRVTADGLQWAPLDRRRLGDDARQIIDDTPLAELPVETVEAAIRLLPIEAAASLWQRIEDRCRAERAWGWAAQVTARVAALEAERDGWHAGAPTIVSALLATQAAARVHTAPDYDPTELWVATEREAPRHPDPRVAALLRLRGRLGRLATGDLNDTAVLSHAPFADTVTGAFTAALHGCTLRGQEVPARVRAAINSVANAAVMSSTGAVALLASAVQCLLAGSLDDATRWVDRAVEVAGQAAGMREMDLPEWVPPRRLAEQCRLVRMIIAWRRGEPLDAVPWQAWRADALRHLDDIDCERLAAATIRFELGHRLIPLAELEPVVARDPDIPSGQPRWLHRQVEPLVVELAEAMRVSGYPLTSVQLLRDSVEAAVAAGTAPDLIEACELALVRMCRQERTTEYAAVTRLSGEGSPRTRTEAWLVRTLIDGQQPRSPAEAGSWHTWWRCQDTASLARLDAVPPPPTAASAAEAADRAEFARLVPALATDRGPDDSAGWARDFDPEGEIRLGRQLSLAPGALGRAMMSAAEVTALRSPEHAVPLLRRAADNLASIGDQRGFVLARLLADLTLARGGNRREVEAFMPDTESLSAATAQAGRGWRQRAEVINGYLSRGPVPAGLPRSPELRLPTAAKHRRFSSARRTLRVVMVATILFLAAVFVVAPIVAAPTGGRGAFVLLGYVASLVAGVVPGAAVARLAAPLLSQRFIRSRAIEVSRPEDGLVAARAVPSRGVRDLRGLGLATIGGALIGFWPLLMMFVPWRGRWAQSLPSDPAPVFNLDGLRLPGRSRSGRLSIIEIRADAINDQLLPWEQWLGSAVPAERATALLWYRKVAGWPWSPSRREWRLGTSAEYYGPGGKRNSGVWRVNLSLTGYRMVHVVGTPVPTGAGWRLRVADPNAAATASRRAEAGERLLSLDDFMLRHLALAVLQADPVDSPAQTLGSQRLGFMSCAQDFIATGANAVLVIPPLPDNALESVAETLWKTVADRRTPPSPTTLLLVQAQVKKLVAQASPPASSGQRPVFDVVLFLRGRGSA